MSYTLEKLCTIGAYLEKKFSPIGIHVAIGGSCLYRGHSEKDMDVFLYPHTNKDIDKRVVIKELESLGFSMKNTDDCEQYPSTNVPDVLVTMSPTFERIDFFILSRYNSTPCDSEVPLLDLHS